MFKKMKKNPIYELQMQLQKEGVIFGVLDENQQVESDDKISNVIITRIYHAGMDRVKFAKWKIIFTSVMYTVIFLALVFTVVVLPLLKVK